MKLWFFSLLPLLVFASVNEPIRCQIASGYRNDRLHWHLQLPGADNALTYRELYRDVQFWENQILFKVIHRDLVFSIQGSYAAFGRGTLFQKYADLPFTAEQPHFQFSTDGWAADANGYFGYAIDLTPDRWYKVLVIPFLGYQGRFEHLKGSSPSPDPLVASSFTMQSTLPHPLHQTWNGFFLGGGFQIETGGRFVLQANYAHSWVHFKFKTHMNRSGSETVQSKVQTSDGGNQGQTGWAQIDYLFSNRWRLGFGGEVQYFSTRVLDASVQTKTNGIPSNASQKFKLRWTTASGWMQVARQF